MSSRAGVSSGALGDLRGSRRRGLAGCRESAASARSASRRRKSALHRPPPARWGWKATGTASPRAARRWLAGHADEWDRELASCSPFDSFPAGFPSNLFYRRSAFAARPIRRLSQGPFGTRVIGPWRRRRFKESGKARFLAIRVVSRVVTSVTPRICGARRCPVATPAVGEQQTLRKACNPR